MERFIAVDDVCAWPNLTTLPDGTITAVIFNQPTHGGWEGDVECWASTDGRKWQRRGTVARHAQGTNRMNVAAGRAGDGSLIALVSGWDNRPGPSPLFPESNTLECWVCRSHDGGRTWQQRGEVARTGDMDRDPIPFGDVIALKDGRLGAVLYDRSAYFYASADGFNWEPEGRIGNGGECNETALLPLGDGRVLAVSRTWDDGHLEAFVSGDGGATWARRGPVSLGAQHPAHLLALQDGRILLAFGLRNAGLYGVGVRISADGAESWGPMRVLVNLGAGPVDCGYPASAQIEDGTIITAYYAAQTDAHARYHMGVIRWQPE